VHAKSRSLFILITIFNNLLVGHKIKLLYQRSVYIYYFVIYLQAEYIIVLMNRLQWDY